MGKALGQKQNSVNTPMDSAIVPSAHEEISAPVDYTSDPESAPTLLIPQADGNLVLTDWNDVKISYIVVTGVPLLFRAKSIDAGSVTVIAQW